MKKIFFVLMSLFLFAEEADARFGGRVGGFRSFSRPSISRSYSRPTTRPATVSAAKPAAKTATKAKTAESSTKKDVQPKKETESSNNTIVQSSSGSMMPWFFAGYMINRNSSNGNIYCDCSPLKDKPEMYQKCLQQCPKDRK